MKIIILFLLSLLIIQVSFSQTLKFPISDCKKGENEGGYVVADGEDASWCKMKANTPYVKCMCNFEIALEAYEKEKKRIVNEWSAAGKKATDLSSQAWKIQMEGQELYYNIQKSDNFENDKKVAIQKYTKAKALFNESKTYRKKSFELCKKIYTDCEEESDYDKIGREREEKTLQNDLDNLRSTEKKVVRTITSNSSSNTTNSGADNTANANSNKTNGEQNKSESEKDIPNEKSRIEIGNEYYEKGWAYYQKDNFIEAKKYFELAKENGSNCVDGLGCDYFINTCSEIISLTEQSEQIDNATEGVEELTTNVVNNFSRSPFNRVGVGFMIGPNYIFFADIGNEKNGFFLGFGKDFSGELSSAFGVNFRFWNNGNNDGRPDPYQSSLHINFMGMTDEERGFLYGGGIKMRMTQYLDLGLNILSDGEEADFNLSFSINLINL